MAKFTLNIFPKWSNASTGHHFAWKDNCVVLSDYKGVLFIYLIEVNENRNKFVFTTYTYKCIYNQHCLYIYIGTYICKNYLQILKSPHCISSRLPKWEQISLNECQVIHLSFSLLPVSLVEQYI